MKNTFLFSRDTIKKFGGLVITLANKSPRESVSWLLCYWYYTTVVSNDDVWNFGEEGVIFQCCNHVMSTSSTRKTQFAGLAFYA